MIMADVMAAPRIPYFGISIKFVIRLIKMANTEIQ
jgi:hypothetical protein